MTPVPSEESKEELQLLQMLDDLRKAYELAAKPYVDRLVSIQNMKMPSFILTEDEAEWFADSQAGDKLKMLRGK